MILLVTEDDLSNVTATGTISVSDADTGENTVTASALYGTVVINSGVWTYSLDSSNATVNALTDGASLPDTITFTSADGTTETQVITITGANDVAVITVAASDNAVTEDDLSNVTATGTISVSDADIGENTVTASALYGTVVINSGVWTYSLDSSNATVNALTDGASLPDTITFTSADGTTETQVITITGANDVAVITLTASDTLVTEDDLSNVTATGTISVSDADTGENTVTASALYGTVVINSGVWTYSLDSSNATVNALTDGASLPDTITFTSADGTTETQVITITGANDVAVITVAASDTLVTEDDLSSCDNGSSE